MTGPDRLRPNEVAGTGDPHAEKLTELLRERFGDAYKDMLIPIPPGRPPISWADMVVPFEPGQDAPALGFYTQPLIGAEAVPDATPPTVTTPDPVAELVKAYKLIKNNPGCRPDSPGPDRWIRLADVAANGDTLDGIIGTGYTTALRDIAYQAARNLDGCLRDLPDGWSWCEHEFEWSSTDPGPFLVEDRVAFTARVKGHRMAPGEECSHVGMRRAVYGPMTPEIRRAAGQ